MISFVIDSMGAADDSCVGNGVVGEGDMAWVQVLARYTQRGR